MIKNKKNTRFEYISSEGSEFSAKFTVVLDKQTGVNYIMVNSGYGLSLTPLLDREGRPVIGATGYTPEY